MVAARCARWREDSVSADVAGVYPVVAACCQAGHRAHGRSARPEAVSSRAGDRGGFDPSLAGPVQPFRIGHHPALNFVDWPPVIEHIFDSFTNRTVVRDRLRDMVSIGDRVLLVAGGVSVFTVVEFDGDHAVVESIQADAPGCYRFPVPTAELVAADSDSGGGD